MNTQISFKVDESLKNSAMKVAKEQGIALSSFLKLSLENFASGKVKVGLLNFNNEIFNTKTQNKIKEIENDISKNKNLSPSLNNAKEAIKFLKDAN